MFGIDNYCYKRMSNASKQKTSSFFKEMHISHVLNMPGHFRYRLKKIETLLPSWTLHSSSMEWLTKYTEIGGK
jgi:hypothetical protein